MTIVRSYLFRQFLRTAVSVSAILLAIGLVDVMFRLIRETPDPSSIAYLALLYVINAFVGSILPIGVYFGLFVVIGRMCQTQELYSIYGNGVPRIEVRRVLALIVIPILLFSVAVSFFIYPALKIRTNQLGFSTDRERINSIIQSGGIFSNGEFTAMSAPPGAAGAEDADGEPASGAMVIIKREGSYLIQVAGKTSLADAKDSAGGDNTIDAGAGQAYYRDDSTGAISHFDFDQAQYLTEPPSTGEREPHYKEKNIIALWQSDRLVDRIELQRRTLGPTLVLLCLIFAVYCAEILPRQSTYSRIPQAMVLLVVSFSTVRFGGDLIKSGVLPVQPGIWALFPLIVMLAVGLYRIQRR